VAETPGHRRKIVEADELTARIERARSDGQSIVQCHGCFDIVHPGHIRHLEFARRQGDLLVVTLTADTRIEKGDQRPYIPQELRAESLAALEFVDLVHVSDDTSAESVLRLIEPDVYVKGREYETSRDPRFLAECQLVESAGGRIIFSSGDVVFSSTQIVRTLPRIEQLERHRLSLICRRNGIDRAALDALLTGMSGLRVAVVGDIILDHYIFCDALDVATEAPTLSLKRLDEREFVGGAAIVARHAAALGAETTLLGPSISRSDGEGIRSVLDEEGVRFMPMATRSQPIRKSRFLVEDSKLLKVESSHVLPLDSNEERTAAAAMESLSRAVDAIIFCDFGYGMITAPLLQRVLPCLRENVAVLSADVSGTRGSLVHFRCMDLLCPTERELRHTLHDFDAGLSSVAWHLTEMTQARHLICTLGKGGLVAFDRPTQDPRSPRWSDRLLSEHLPSFADRCIDRLGCGDALLAASTLALAAGGTLLQAAYLGNAASAIAIARLGNHPVSTADLTDWLTHRPETHTSTADQVRTGEAHVPARAS